MSLGELPVSFFVYSVQCVVMSIVVYDFLRFNHQEWFGCRYAQSTIIYFAVIL